MNPEPGDWVLQSARPGEMWQNVGWTSEPDTCGWALSLMTQAARDASSVREYRMIYVPFIR